MGTLADANPTRLSKRSQGCPLTEFVTKQILMEENSHGNASHIALMGDGKGKKFSQGSSTDSDAKKKNMKCHYYKKKEHVKPECRKLKADQAAGIVPENKRVEEKPRLQRLP